MPLFEYACKDCATRFETLVWGSETPECPSCHSQSLEKRQSTFAAVGTPRAIPGTAAATGCGSCGDPRGPGSCSMN